MPASQRALVTPELLVWARRSIGFSVEAAARRTKLTVEQISTWEAGDAQPTIVQARKLAKSYRRPLAVLFLPRPPKAWDVMRDFRRLPDMDASSWSPELHTEYRRALDQREIALELAGLMDEAVPTDWKVTGTSALAIAQAARAKLIEVAPIPFPAGGDQYAHLGYWTAALEAAGVLVMTSTGIAKEEMRGFSLHYDELPVIVTNGKDWPRGRSFSLMHEYAHLLLHSPGLCDQLVLEDPQTDERRLEQRCNLMAAEMLVPAAELAAETAVARAPDGYTGWTDEVLLRLARPFGVSAETVLRRLLFLGKTTQAFYAERREHFLRIYDQAEQRRQARKKDKPSGDYYRTHARDLGKGYVRQVVTAYRTSVIGTYTTADYLDAPVRAIDGLARAASLRSEP
jgi:Zn-dependent peptidase ImmA (M78 family)